VDRSFIALEGQEQRAAVILSAIIAMGHELGLAVVAEGIESQEQVDRLGVLGCDYGQGYFIGRPMSAKQVNDALAGLPYAFSSGRTAITWLWERGIKDPAPEPQLRPVTGLDLEKPGTKPRRPFFPPRQPSPVAVAPPAPAPVPPQVEAQPVAPQPPAAQEKPATAPEQAAAEPETAVGTAVDQAPPQAAEGGKAATDQPEPAAQPIDPDAPPPPAPRRRKRQRRAPQLGEPEG
jgi:hypothetical protein